MSQPIGDDNAIVTIGGSTSVSRPAVTPFRLWGHVLLNLFVALTGAYSISVVLFLMLRMVIGERWQVIALINDSLHLLLMPSLLLLPVCLIRRRWRLALLQLPAFVTFASAYAVLFLPNDVPVPPNTTEITVLTYNMQAEEDLLDPMIEVIRSANADIVALQEFSATAAARFDAEFANMYPYRALHPVSSPYNGRAVLSRYPILDDHAWPEEYPIPVRLQRVVLDVDGIPLTVYNMHAPPSTPIYGQGYDVRPRAEQIADLLHMGAQDTGAVLLLGDFNTTDMDENYGRITALFADTFREVGWGLGFTNPDWQHDNPRRGPSFVPMYQRIDYVFHNDALVAIEARVWPSSGGSDHRPLFARLALTSR